MNPFTDAICAYWENGAERKHVAIHHGPLTDFADELAEMRRTVPRWDMPGVFPQNDEAWLWQMWFLNAINACTTELDYPHRKFAIEDPGTGTLICGSTAIAACFYRYFGENPALPKDIIAIMSRAQRAKRFFQGSVPIPLLNDRRTHLLEVATHMRHRTPLGIFEEQGWHVFETSSGKPGIVLRLATLFPTAFGSDHVAVHVRDGRRLELAFLKRAQLLPMMYQGRATHSKGALPLLRDAAHIGPIIDTRIPNTLRGRGILRYSPHLRHKIDNQLPIERRSVYEIELRTAAAAAMAALFKETNARKEALDLPPWEMMHLDYPLFCEGKTVDFHHHIVATMDY